VDFVFRIGNSEQSALTQEVGGALLESIIAYDKKSYTEAADLLNSVKYKIVKVGGSNAQVSKIRWGLSNIIFN